MRAVVTVVGRDRVGIIAEVCAELASRGVNILDIAQTIIQEFFTMTMLVDASGCSVPFVELSELLREHGESTNLEIRVRREEIFDITNRI